MIHSDEESYISADESEDMLNESLVISKNFKAR